MIWLQRIGIGLLVVGLLIGLDWVLNATLVEYAVRMIILCGINVILAVGLNLINGTTGQFSIGHAGFMAVGAYATAFAVIHLEDDLGSALASMPALLAHGLVLVAGLTFGAILAGFTGFLVGAPSLRLRGDYLAIVTLGFGEIIRLLFNNSSFFGGATGYTGGRSGGLPTYTGPGEGVFGLFWVAICVVLVIILIRNLTASSYGRTLRAIREDEIASEAVGIPTTRMKIVAFVVSAMSAGVAGGLFAHLQGSISPNDFKMDKSIDMIVMIIVGGLGSVTGAVIGAVFVSMIFALTLELPTDYQQYRLVLYALLLIILMIVRPQGLLGQREFVPAAILARFRGPKKAAK